MVDDETVLNLAKKRLQTIRAKSYSLEKLAVRTLLKNIRFYLNSDGQLGQLKSLPGVLRDKILQTLIQRRNIDDNGKTEEINDLMGIFPFLLSSRTRCIELNGIMSFACPRRFKTKRYLDQEETDVTTLKKETECCVQLLQWIEALAPKVETLIIMKNNPFPEISDPSHKKPLVKLEMLQTLKKLPNLKTLRVDLFRFKKNDLLEMCKNLPNLHNLTILCNNSGPDPSPEVFTSNFCNVKQITVNNFRWLADLCNKHLPDVEIVPFNQSQIFDWHIKIYDRKKRSVSRLPCQPNRQHIYLDLAGNQIRPKEFEVFPALFPNVSCFTLILLSENSWEYYGNEYPEAVSSLPKFDHIRQLNLAIEYKHSPLLILERLLSTYGQNLQTLNLTCKFPSLKIDLAIILKNCPKLEKLSLVKICLQKSTLPIAVFTELKDLELRYPHLAYYLSYPRYEEETMILSNILSAPKLEKVVLEGAFFNEFDLMRLNTLIQKKQILSRLHTFHFYLNCYANERLKYLTNFLKTACAFLPKLSDFRIGRRINFDHPLLTCAIRTDDKVFDECIRSLLQLMENEK